jgi:hypothetical protein
MILANRSRAGSWDCVPIVLTLLTPIHAASKASASFASWCGSATIERKGMRIYRTAERVGRKKLGPLGAAGTKAVVLELPLPPGQLRPIHPRLASGRR